MKKRPVQLWIFAAAMFGIVLSMPLQVPFIQELAWHEFSLIFEHLTWLNLLTMVAALSLGLLSIEASRAILMVGPIAFVIMALNNYWVGAVGLNYSMWSANIATLAYMCTHLVLLAPSTRAVFVNPQLRWWRTAERKVTTLPTTLYPWIGEAIGASSCNISSTGILVKTYTKPNLKVGEQVRLKVNFDGYYDVRCVAELVRIHNKNGADYAAFRFIDIDRKERKFLTEYTA